MPNTLQKCIYIFSSAVPLLLTFAIVWYVQKRTIIIPLICIIVSLVLLISFIASFRYLKKNLPLISIKITGISPYDSSVIVYLISYVLPFASIALKDLNLLLAGTISLAVIIVAPFINSAFPNPLLTVCGYHFYRVSTENGVADYVLITKKKLRSNNDLQYVKRIFEFLLLEEAG